MKKLFVLLFIISIIFISCGPEDSASGRAMLSRSFTDYPAVTPVVRAKILEDNTITYCVLSSIEKKTLRPTDTIWLNLSTHSVDDVSENTMKAVLYRP